MKIRGSPDASYATCKRTQRSVTGFAVFVKEVIVELKSGMQRVVALSTADAEVDRIVRVESCACNDGVLR